MTEQIKLKICSKCKTEKPTSDFPEEKICKDGLRGNCKSCYSEKKKAYREANKEAISENRKARYAANSEAIAERGKAYRKANQEAIAERKKAYSTANAEVLSEKQKEYYAANANVLCEKNRAYYTANKEAICAQKKEYAEANKDIISKKRKAYYEANVPDFVKRAQAYRETRRKNDTLFDLSLRIRSLIGCSLNRQGYSKNSKTYKILGCSFEQFKAHIESQFVEGMCWDRMSEIHLDHIYPVSKAVDEEHLIALNHYTNFQPLWAADNIRKSNKIPDHSHIYRSTNQK